MKLADFPIAYVYVHFTRTDDDGHEHVTRYVCAHDGALQAAEEAIRYTLGDPLPLGVRVREVEVFAGVQPRSFQYEPEVRRTFSLRERG